MSSYDVELAKEFKNRDNESKIGAILGKVVDADNLTISILDGKALITKPQLYICSILKESYARTIESISVDNGTINSITFKDILKVGDIVMLVASENGQEYFVIDKVVF